MTNITSTVSENLTQDFKDWAKEGYKLLAKVGESCASFTCKARITEKDSQEEAEKKASKLGRAWGWTVEHIMAVLTAIKEFFLRLGRTVKGWFTKKEEKKEGQKPVVVVDNTKAAVAV